MAVVADGPVAGSLMGLLEQLKLDLFADLLVVSNLDSALATAQVGIPLGREIPEHLTPLVGIVAGQLFAHYLTLAKGLDPEKPRTISKVTETR